MLNGAIGKKQRQQTQFDLNILFPSMCCTTDLSKKLFSKWKKMNIKYR